jgi:hypothetical protein
LRQEKHNEQIQMTWWERVDMRTNLGDWGEKKQEKSQNGAML